MNAEKVAGKGAEQPLSRERTSDRMRSIQQLACRKLDRRLQLDVPWLSISYVFQGASAEHASYATQEYWQEDHDGPMKHQHIYQMELSFPSLIAEGIPS